MVGQQTVYFLKGFCKNISYHCQAFCSQPSTADQIDFFQYFTIKRWGSLTNHLQKQLCFSLIDCPNSSSKAMYSVFSNVFLALFHFTAFCLIFIFSSSFSFLMVSLKLYVIFVCSPLTLRIIELKEY